MKRISQKTHPNLYEVLLEAGGARRQKRRKVIEREQKIMETGTLTHTFQQLGTVVSFDFG